MNGDLQVLQHRIYIKLLHATTRATSETQKESPGSVEKSVALDTEL